jgi:hypothetical protein
MTMNCRSVEKINSDHESTKDGNDEERKGENVRMIKT